MFSKLIYQHTDTFRTTQAHKSCCQDGNYRVWKRAKSTHSGWRSRRHEGKPDWLWWAIRGIKSLQKVTRWRPARNHTQCPLCTRTLPAQFSSSKPALFQRLLWPSCPSAPEQAHRLTHVLGLSWGKIHHPQRADITDVFVQKSAVVQHHFCTNIPSNTMQAGRRADCPKLFFKGAPGTYAAHHQMAGSFQGTFYINHIESILCKKKERNCICSVCPNSQWSCSL